MPLHNSYQPWRLEEVRLLEQHYGIDMTPEELAEQLGRTAEAVRKKARDMARAAVHLDEADEQLAPAKKPATEPRLILPNYRCLTLEEAKQAWRMAEDGMDMVDLALHFRTGLPRIEEALQAAPILLGLEPLRLPAPRQRQKPLAVLPKMPEKTTAPTTPLQRPAAVYSNRSPYGVAQPGNTMNP